MTKEQSLQYCTASHEVIWSHLKDTEFPSNPRNDLVLAYLAIALEHQHAICNLIGLGLFGSALALLRSQLESAFRGLWVNLIATDEQVVAIREKGAEPFPRFKEMAKELDARYGSGGWLSSFVDSWAALNGYTHSGLEQLGRPFRADGNLAPSYPEEVIAELATTSGTISIGTIVPVFRHFRLDSKAQELEAWLAENGAPQSPADRPTDA